MHSTLEGLERVAALLLHLDLAVTNQLKFFLKLIQLISTEPAVVQIQATTEVLKRISELFQNRLDGVQRQGAVTESETAAKYSPGSKLESAYESLKTEDPNSMDEELSKLTDKLNVSPKVTFEKDKESISLHLALYNNKQEHVPVEEAIKDIWAVSGGHVESMFSSK